MTLLAVYFQLASFFFFFFIFVWNFLNKLICIMRPVVFTKLTKKWRIESTKHFYISILPSISLVENLSTQVWTYEIFAREEKIRCLAFIGKAALKGASKLIFL